ncbi:L-serine ammonia-lyase, iron-sulfur-dependent, subunit alpha [Treponema maltophilum]|uniref:L-serine ammonia-lyase, iron-sulfur-dependent, subunit alpha n=1 Tax=Treponema maltophilum TaxID=51160 RepID=UPI003D8AAD6A
MYQNFEQLLSLCSEKKEALWRIILENECTVQNTTENAVFAELDKRFTVMEESAAKALDKPLATAGNLISGYACRHNAYNKKTPGLCGTFINRVIALALSVSEVNASMGRICAAPTAGASGIIPAVLIALKEKQAKGAAGRKKILKALLTASGIGTVIVKNATVSGAEGGCQAECASAAGMASAAAVEFAGGTPAQSLDAFCFCLMNAMGLICDPVAGLVQVPCAQRNASQAVNALLSADMALAGMTSPIPADEVLEAMYRVGKMLPFELKETARGGIAATKTGKLLRKTLLNG